MSHCNTGMVASSAIRVKIGTPPYTCDVLVHAKFHLYLVYTFVPFGKNNAEILWLVEFWNFGGFQTQSKFGMQEWTNKTNPCQISVGSLYTAEIPQNFLSLLKDEKRKFFHIFNFNKLNVSAQLQTFLYLTVSKPFPYSNAL